MKIFNFLFPVFYITIPPLDANRPYFQEFPRLSKYYFVFIGELLCLVSSFLSISRYPPFFDDNPFGIYEKILAGKVEWPRHMENTSAK